MDLHEQAALLPTEPGVYLFKDRHGTVLYVGKARNLRARVKQYLSGHDTRQMIRYLMAAARAVDVVPVHNEREALLLENTLIKQHQPRFNTRLRDDKSFLHLRIDTRAPWPRVTLARRIEGDRARTFGPYTSATAARQTLALVQRSFPMRTCTDQVLKSRTRPCLVHQMKRCVAPCVSACTKESYDAIVDDAVAFLSGRTRALRERVQARMVQAAEEERFEDAARLRDLLATLVAESERQSVVDVKLGDRDAWALAQHGAHGVAVQVSMRGGALLEPRAFPFQALVGEPGELLSSFLNAYYDEAEIPPEILVPVAPDDADALSAVLAERRRGAVRLHVPQRGDKLRIVEIAEETARARAEATDPRAERLARALEGLAELADLPAPPLRIECFDNSNLQGTDPVASQVVFLEGRPSRKDYRRYKVRTVVGADDFATMAEILERRLRRGVEADDLPDLVVVDGGAGQLNAALAVRDRLGLSRPAMIGLSKPRTERRHGDRDATDKIVLPGQDDPVRLAEHDPILRLLQHLRDEAHDTAVNFHRTRRSRSHLHGLLDEVPGIGKARRVALLRHFGSVSALRDATPEALAEAPGMGPALAARIHAALHKAGDAST